MTSNVSISIRRRLLLTLTEGVLKLLWFIDKVTSLDIRYLPKAFFYVLIFSISSGFFLFIGYSMRTGYLSDIAYEKISPDYVPLQSVVVRYPISRNTHPSLEISAKSAVAIDKKTNKVLFEKNPDEKLPPASTVKLMTALIAKDIYDDNEVLTVSKSCTEVDSTKVMLKEGDAFTVSDLIKSMLIGSAGDSACVIANSKIDEGEFVNKMNDKAQVLGMSSTNFSNPIGLDGVDNSQHSTAKDLYKLSKHVTSFPDLGDIVGTKSFTMYPVGEENFLTVTNTNKTLWSIDNSVGVKTGTTRGAGEVLVYEYRDDEKDIFIVVMGSRDRFTDTEKILDWVNEHYIWK